MTKPTPNTAHVPMPSRRLLEGVAAARIFFAHQSVGLNILEGVSTVYESNHLAPVRYSDVGTAGPQEKFLHTRIAKNGDPLDKIHQFDILIRAGLGDGLDVAILKLCYADVRGGADVQGVFTVYRRTMRALQRDYPATAFVAVTVPLTVNRGLRAGVKERLGRGDRLGPEHNAVREELNALIRNEYQPTHHLFDLARVESTTTNGGRVTGCYRGRNYPSLSKNYASDSGHLNPAGAALAAAELLRVIGGTLTNGSPR